MSQKLLFTVCVLLRSLCFGDCEKGLAYFDSSAIWESLDAFQEPKKELDEALATLQKSYGATEEDLRKESQDLQKKRMDLVETADSKNVDEAQKMEGLLRAFDEKVLGVQKEVDQKKRCISEVYESANQYLHKVVFDAVKDVAQAKRIMAVISKDMLIYGEKSLDITKDVQNKILSQNIQAPLNFSKCL